MIRRLKTQGANQSELCDIYNKHVRSILENSAAVWHAGLTQINSTDIEHVQKSAFSIILGKNYKSYENALRILGMEKLKDRRENICLKFAQKSLKSKKFSSWFVPDTKSVNTRRKLTKVKGVKTRTARFEKSALPFLSSILNKN